MLLCQTKQSQFHYQSVFLLKEKIPSGAFLKKEHQNSAFRLSAHRSSSLQNSHRPENAQKRLWKGWHDSCKMLFGMRLTTGDSSTVCHLNCEAGDNSSNH